MHGEFMNAKRVILHDDAELQSAVDDAEAIEARVLIIKQASPLLDLRLGWNVGKPNQLGRAFTYSGRFTVEWG